MRCAAIALAVLSTSLLVPGSTVLAQGLPQPGERVRVTSGIHAYSQLVATVKAISAESLVVTANGTDIHLAMAQVSLVEIVVGQKSHAGDGAAVGALVGMAVGGAIGAATASCEPSQGFAPDFCGLEKGFAGAAGAAIGGFVLGVTGWLIGGAIKSDRWEEVPLDNVRVSFVPQRDGRFRLGMSVSF